MVIFPTFSINSFDIEHPEIIEQYINAGKITPFARVKRTDTDTDKPTERA